MYTAVPFGALLSAIVLFQIDVDRPLVYTKRPPPAAIALFPEIVALVSVMVADDPQIPPPSPLALFDTVLLVSIIVDR